MCIARIFCERYLSKRAIGRQRRIRSRGCQGLQSRPGTYQAKVCSLHKGRHLWTFKAAGSAQAKKRRRPIFTTVATGMCWAIIWNSTDFAFGIQPPGWADPLQGSERPRKKLAKQTKLARREWIDMRLSMSFNVYRDVPALQVCQRGIGRFQIKSSSREAASLVRTLAKRTIRSCCSNRSKPGLSKKWAIYQESPAQPGRGSFERKKYRAYRNCDASLWRAPQCFWLTA